MRANTGSAARAQCAFCQKWHNTKKDFTLPWLLQKNEMIQREIESTDKTINSLVYELYGSTEAEIKIVEGGV